MRREPVPPCGLFGPLLGGDLAVVALGVLVVPVLLGTAGFDLGWGAGARWRHVVLGGGRVARDAVAFDAVGSVDASCPSTGRVRGTRCRV